MIKGIALITAMLCACSSDPKVIVANVPISNEAITDTMPFKLENMTLRDKTFIPFWKQFTKVIEAKNIEWLKSMSLDTIETVEKSISIDLFIKDHFSTVFDDALIKSLSIKDRIDVIEWDAEIENISPYLVKKLKPGVKTFIVVNIFKKYNEEGNPHKYLLHFLKTERGYKYYGYASIG